MKIVHVITRFVPGGADENTLLTCNHQVQRGNSVALVVGSNWDRRMKDDLDPRVEFIVASSLVQAVSPVKDLLALMQLHRLLSNINPDVVHTHTSKAGVLGRIAARTANVPSIVHGVHILAFRNVPAFFAWTYIAAERFCGTFTDLFVHVSHDMLAECARRGIGTRAAHVVIESGMAIGKYRSAGPPDDVGELTAGPLGQPDRPFTILSLAQLDPRKGLHLLLPVLRRVVDKRPNVVLLMAGVGGQLALLKRQAARLNLSANLRILGFRRDVENLLAIADVLVICSQREGLPRVAIQAGIAGVPIVTTDLPGIRTVVEQGRTGMIVPISGIEQMEQCLLKLIDDPALTESMSIAIASKDYSAWDTEGMMRRMDEAYELARHTQASDRDSVAGAASGT